MITNTTPQLDPQRIDQMISNAMSYKQDAKRGLLPTFRHPFAWGFGASLAAASILGVLYLNPAVQPKTSIIPYRADISDIMLYDLLEDLG